MLLQILRGRLSLNYLAPLPIQEPLASSRPLFHSLSCELVDLLDSQALNGRRRALWCLADCHNTSVVEPRYKAKLECRKRPSPIRPAGGVWNPTKDRF